MNKQRRKAIAGLVERLESLKAEAESIVESIRDLEAEETDYYENMPESFQMGEKGQAAEEARDALCEAADELESVDVDAIKEAMERAAE